MKDKQRNRWGSDPLFLLLFSNRLPNIQLDLISIYSDPFDSYDPLDSALRFYALDAVFGLTVRLRWRRLHPRWSIFDEYSTKTN